MDIQLWGILAAVCSLIAVIVLYAAVLPRRRNGKLGGFGQWLHDYFRFKRLYIEGILRFLFVVLTVVCVFGGLLLCFVQDEYGFLAMSLGVPLWVVGLSLMIAGPISLRLSYELLMMGILLVQNVIDINRKLAEPVKSEPEEKPTTAEKKAKQPKPPKPPKPAKVPAYAQPQRPVYTPPAHAWQQPQQQYAPPVYQAPQPGFEAAPAEVPNPGQYSAPAEVPNPGQYAAPQQNTYGEEY